METLRNTLESVMSGYAGKALNGESWFTKSSDEQVFTVVSIGQINGRQFVDTSLIARVVRDHIVIDHDANNKLLVDALVQAGVPRQQIVLAYAGESLDHAA